LLGWETTRLYPNAWISRAIGPHGVRSKRDARKALARECVAGFGIDVEGHTQDECDALCILLAAIKGEALDVQTLVSAESAHAGLP
jgi:hypothetical protein